jgi:hypothetical protein
MYADHQPLLSKLGRSGPDGFRRIAVFALCTIRVPLYQTVLDYPRALRGLPCGAIFGAKYLGLSELDERAADYYEQCERAYHDLEGEELEDELLSIVTAIPSIGPAKGGFIVQMIYGVSGCLDRHNLARFSIPERAFRLDRGTRPSRRSALIHDYGRVCRGIGGTQMLWDSWCSYMAERDANYNDAEHVSRLHLTPLKD